MLENFHMENLKQFRAFSHSIRSQVLFRLAVKSMTCAQLARAMKMPRQRMHYHLKILRDAGLVVQAKDLSKNDSVEKYYRAIAKNFIYPFAKDLVPLNEADLSKHAQRAETLSEVTQTFIEQVKADLQQPDIARKMSHLGGPFQHAVYLTPEQESEKTEQFRMLLREICQLSDENCTSKNPEDLIMVRYTLLITSPNLGEE